MTALLGGTGVWSRELRYDDPDEIARNAAELESLGYTALWIPDRGGRLFHALDRLLAATSAIVVASGILNVWRHTPAETATWWESLQEDSRSRLLLGLGVSHGPIVGEGWGRPLATIGAFLDELDARGVPRERRAVAALGPKMLELAGRRSSGAHPYLVTPEHTEAARATLGDAGLYVEQGVVLERDAAVARRIARADLETYCALPNYVRSWKRLGFTQEDIETRSDRFVDALFAWGGIAEIQQRIDAHRSAGADHVCIQVLRGEDSPSFIETLRALAPRRSQEAAR
ncbi:MAG: TIGR03620 family F420-dependent LLM class oxidoreductase [Solirubrobacteraceae bacterium]